MNSGRRIYAWAVCGVAAVIVYGSLVPFQFRAITISEALDEFFTIIAAGPKIVSRSDALANVMLGVPLGFALLGLRCVEYGWPTRTVVRSGLLLLPLCAGFSALVEFLQLFTLTRSCSFSDILAQTLGAAAGMALWIWRGQLLTNHVLGVWNRADLDAAGRLLVGYVALLAFIQTLPFDLSASPYDLYRKLRDGGVRIVPFGEFHTADPAEQWREAGKLAKLAGLYFPVGLLAARLRGRVEGWGAAKIALAALTLAFGLEAVQLLVKSRSPGVTDALLGAAAVVAGWYAARIHREGLAIPFALSWGIIWLAGMTLTAFPPPGTPSLEEPRPFDWMPGLPLESGDPLHTLEEMLTKLVLFGLLGVLVAAWYLPPRTRRGPVGSVRSAALLALVLGLLTAAVFENNQRWYVEHTPCITDVLLGGLGALLGVLVGSRLVMLRSTSGRLRSL